MTVASIGRRSTAFRDRRCLALRTVVSHTAADASDFPSSMGATRFAERQRGPRMHAHSSRGNARTTNTVRVQLSLRRGQAI